MADIVIRVTPERLQGKAGEISDEIGKIKGAFDQIDERIRNTRNFWEGDASNANFQYYSKLKQELDDVVNKLKRHPTHLLTMAGLYRSTESENQAAAQTLSADVIL